MIKLHGFPRSNFYTIVKLALVEKGIPFEECFFIPETALQITKDSNYLSKSPMGKVPCIETQQGFLSETNIILDYLDDLGEGPSFYPNDPFEKAKVRELIKVLELYIEHPARQLYGETFFSPPIPAANKLLIREQLKNGFKAVAALTNFDPYIAGKKITYADFVARFTIGVATLVTEKVFAWDAHEDVPGLKQYLQFIDQRETVIEVFGEMEWGEVITMNHSNEEVKTES